MFPMFAAQSSLFINQLKDKSQIKKEKEESLAGEGLAGL